MSWQAILQRQQEWSVESAIEHRLSIEDATELYANAPIHELTMAADKRRRLLHPGGKVTYLVDRNVNYTNVCTINCQFCSFYRPPGHDETYTQTFDEISARVSELEEIGGSRILMQGGVNPDLEFSWYVDLISYLVKNHPGIHLDCFSPIEIEGIAEVSGMTTLEVLRELQKAGLHGLPGGGAELLVDDVRKDISPKKGSPDNWLRVMQEAQSLGLTTSATNVFGFGETLRQRIEHMSRIRDHQDYAIEHYGKGFTSFIAWPVQLESNTFGKRNRGQNKHVLGAGPTEYIRHLAISRLFFDNISSIQASWPTMGLGIAQIALLSGANDAGSTMMEENVVSASGTTKMSASEIELQNTIIRAGFIPVKRDSDYHHLTTEIAENLSEKLPAPIPIQY
ncbi:MAG: CofH family radical SAM protein [Candidatus Thermoplasmatota archaeon]|nr:CofH family radical SAM protein [Candidatus Thermoplasmatota archaeon]MEC7255629.1 CofH family radical SAM protein [Candidatus Thermoplasmatota archaeon]MEC8312580.1 CofH family radical SAM protein [Candidatus Thermoplasmatota archaeon]